MMAKDKKFEFVRIIVGFRGRYDSDASYTAYAYEFKDEKGLRSFESSPNYDFEKQAEEHAAKHWPGVPIDRTF